MPSSVRGYQLFFSLAGFHAALSIPIWTMRVHGNLGDPGHLQGAVWHGHEMVFGYVAAVLAGFLTLASRGWRIWVLAALWLSGRLLLASSLGPAMLAVILDLLFLPALLILRQPPLWSGRKLMSLGIAVAALGLILANLMIHLRGRIGFDVGAGQDLAWAGVAFLLAVAGGRLIPGYTRAFTGKGVGLHLTRTESLSIILFGCLALADLLSLAVISGVLSLLLAGLQVYRLARWWDRSILAHPLLWGLHLGFAWLAVGLAAHGMAHLTDAPDPVSLDHLLYAGAVGVLTVTMMMRVTLSQRRQKHLGGFAEAAIILLLSLAAICRSLGPMMTADLPAVVAVGALLWTAGFGLFLLRYGPVLART